MLKVFARNCQVANISGPVYSILVKEFLHRNHIQKWTSGMSAIFGLFFEDELVQIMGLGKPRFNDNFQWEIIRECSKKDTQIVGGASKLWKSFQKEYSPVSAIVYTSLKCPH